MTGAMVWAIDAIDCSAKHIAEVRAGLDCKCVCPGCSAVLEAVNSENPFWKKRPHFRHHKSPETEDCAIAAVIMAAKAELASLDEIFLPAIEVTVETKISTGKIVRETLREEATTEKISSYEFVDVTDAILTLENGQQVYVRLSAIGVLLGPLSPKQSQFAEVVIDISDPVLRTADRETLRKHISLDPSGRIWCHHQRWQILRSRAQEISNNKAALHASAQTKSVSPEMREAVGHAWISYPTKGDRSKNVRAVRNLYNDGAFRLYAPPIQYDKVIEEATRARLAGYPLSMQMDAWDKEYRLLGQMKPITQVLIAAGIVQEIFE